MGKKKEEEKKNNSYALDNLPEPVVLPGVGMRDGQRHKHTCLSFVRLRVAKSLRLGCKNNAGCVMDRISVEGRAGEGEVIEPVTDRD